MILFLDSDKVLIGISLIKLKFSESCHAASYLLGDIHANLWQSQYV